MASHRKFMRAYLKAQELHKQVHRITKGFEEDSTDEELLSRISRARQQLAELEELLQ